FAQLAVLSGHEGLLHHRYLDVEILLRQVEVGREGQRDAAVLGFLERERPRFVLPRNPVKVQQAGTFALRVVREAGCLRASGWLGRHSTESSNESGCRAERAGDLLYERRPMGRLRLTPQKREFFDLYSRASANAVEISRILVELI